MPSENRPRNDPTQARISGRTPQPARRVADRARGTVAGVDPLADDLREIEDDAIRALKRLVDAEGRL
jgi:hypothetical protein